MPKFVFPNHFKIIIFAFTFPTDLLHHSLFYSTHNIYNPYRRNTLKFRHTNFILLLSNYYMFHYSTNYKSHHVHSKGED
jgi:hypothetical protein